MRTRALVASCGLVVSLCFATVACGGGSGSSAPAIPADALVVGGVPDLLLDRTAYTVAATNGSVKIAYVNRDTIRHTLVIVDGNRIQQGPRLEIDKDGDVAVGVFTLAPGRYTLVCDVPGHSATMNATLTVT